ncbi:Major facilitator superfamily domain general substrate transporter [Penicillium macrosclerotiorum]|uniref:Major facilitator superfamily domain general substrate transporter n=1 Tax=Penicillium macrosclerotiorum TaxID=303699 RepID=UPI002548DBC5|nr:Major facilitator superfamily domain general substrate transporter [Penicillium macrosclerotiorum]KAJ5683450.1 Major facilitator superfamily domain general substrate transporter [Penicillium macrosclerotiorum]
MRFCCCLIGSFQAFGLYGYDAGVLGGVQDTRPFREALGGFGIGAEMSLTENKRGPEVAFQCVFLVAGCAFAYWVDFGFTRLDNQLSWRFPLALQALFAAVSGVTMFLLPDTPRWYYARNRLDEGDEILARLHDRPISDLAVQEMRQSIILSIQHEAEVTKRISLLDLVWDRTNLRVGRRIRISFLILSIQQMMGINIAVYYSVTIFSQIDLSSTMSQLLAAVINTCFALGSTLLPATIERFGRRNILIYSASGLTICLAVFVGMIGSPHPTLATQWTAVASIIVYNFIFGYGWIGVCWLYGAEIAPLQYRHVGAAAGSFGEWLFCFITVFAGGIGLNNVGWKLWIWCLISCVVAIPLIWFMCPETTGKTLEEINFLFEKTSEGGAASSGDDSKERDIDFVHQENAYP